MRSQQNIMGSQPPVIVSIATIPSRIGSMRPTLESLLAGDVVPDQILVVRPNFSTWEQCTYTIPDFLLDPAFCRGIIKMVLSPRDWGPGTKVLGSLGYLPPECYLILADDDVQYRPTFLAGLLHAQQQRPKSSFSYYTWRSEGLTVGTGCDGFSFWSPNLVGIRAFAERYVEGTPLIYHDDLWISFFLATRGISIKSLQYLLDGQLIYEQVHNISQLRSLTGDLSREALHRTHLARLLKDAGLPASRRSLLRLIALYDQVRSILFRVLRKLRSYLS